MRRALLAAIVTAMTCSAGCSSGSTGAFGEGAAVKLPVKGDILDVGGERVPIVAKVPTYCGCLLVLTAQGGYRVYRYVGPGSPGSKLVAVKAAR